MRKNTNFVDVHSFLFENPFSFPQYFAVLGFFYAKNKLNKQLLF